jgi:hypothetical protein
MKFDFNQPFDGYLSSTDQIAAGLLAPASPFRNVVDRIYVFFTEELLAGDLSLRPVAALLAGNAFMLWLASVRTAVTGHAAAAYPLFRVALESACYCFLTQRDEAIAAVWRDRDTNSEAAKRCRKVMMSAVSEVAAMLNAQQTGLGNDIARAYQAAIDFGAHPNAKSIYHHLYISPPDDEREYDELHLIGLNAPDSLAVRRTLIASIDYAIAIGIVLLHAVPEADQGHADALGQLNMLSDQLMRSWGLRLAAGEVEM